MTQKLLSICIPTYNRAGCLKRLLENIVPQILALEEYVEICISNNHSSDDTKDIVMIFREKYPDLIIYNENEKNIGFDRNLLKVISMAQGEFIWTFSDDDMIVEDGLKEIIEFIKKNEYQNVGGMAVKDSSYVFDLRTSKKIKYHSSVDSGKPEMYGGLGLVEILQGGVPYRFLSALLYNNRLLKKILREKLYLVEKGIGSYYLHSWLFLLLFLLNRGVKCYVLNKSIVISPDTMSKYKFVIEDHFQLIYKGKIKFFDNLLLITDKSNKDTVNAIKKSKGYPSLTIIYAMALFRGFGIADHSSYIKCINISFSHLSFANALLISTSLIMILMIPSS